MPALYQYGDSGFDILRGPGMADVDAAVAKTIALREGLRLQMRVESFNLLNRTNFALPNRILGAESTGVIDHTVTPARRLQLAARFEW
jgi:dUTPase